MKERGGGPTTHYDVLGVPNDAGEDEVRRAYLDRARRHHPDTGGDAATMTAVNEAWTVLSDPASRRRYDVELGVARRPSEVDCSAGPERVERADLEADLLDDRPIRAMRTPGLLPLLPPAIFAGSIAVGCVALVLDEPIILGGAGILFLLSCVAVAAVALLTLRGAGAARR